MSRWLATTVFCCLLVTIRPLEAAEDPGLKQLLDRYEAALRKADVAAVIALYEADGDFVSYAGRHASGAAQLREFYSGVVRRGGLDHSSTIDRVRWLGKAAAIVDGSFEIRRPSGAPLKGYWTAVVTRKGRSYLFRAVRTWTVSDGAGDAR